MFPASVPHGRGARSNAAGRFEACDSQPVDDGWSEAERDGDARKLKTTLTAERARTIISRNDSPDVGFDQSINTYRGCEHGCIYCYARPAHAYVGLSPGIDFESKLFFKPDAAALLAKELARPGYVCRAIAVGGNTDVYQPAERERLITRGVIETLQRFSHPFSVITKSTLIVRDADLIGAMSVQGLAKAYVSVTTLDRELARDMEPRAATPSRRLDAIRRLADAGARVGVGFSPVILGLNDHEMEAVLEAAYDAGAREAMFVMLRLPREISTLFQEWLQTARPDRAARVMSLIRQTHGGRDNDPAFGARMRGSGPLADLTARRFSLACARIGLNAGPRAPLRTDLFSPPRRAAPQPDLFERA